MQVRHDLSSLVRRNTKESGWFGYVIPAPLWRRILASRIGDGKLGRIKVLHPHRGLPTGAEGRLPDSSSAMISIVRPCRLYCASRNSLSSSNQTVARPSPEISNWRCQSTAIRSRKCARSKFSGHRLTPLSQGCGTVSLEDFSAIEVAVLVEVIVYRGVNGGQFLRSPDVPELRHCFLSSSKRLK